MPRSCSWSAGRERHEAEHVLWAAFEESRDVCRRDALQFFQCRLRIERDVGCQQHVVAPGEQMMPEIGRILREYVEGGPAQEAGIEGRREVGLDYESKIGRASCRERV